MYKIIFATGNAGKMKEIREILADLPAQILSMKEAGLEADIVEDGKTFEENAIIKARAVAQLAARGTAEVSCAASDQEAASAENQVVVLADDSGLEIDWLGKEPGIYSARYLGEDTSYHIKNANLISRLEGVPPQKRTARFVCAIAAVLPDGEVCTARGVIEGQIGYEEKGSNGFGYDPIFYLPDRGMTTAELAPEEKNAVSHRGEALRAIKKILVERVKG